MKDRSELIFLLACLCDLALFVFFVTKPIYSWQILLISLVFHFFLLYFVVGKSNHKSSIASFAVFPIIANLSMFMAVTLPEDKSIVYSIGFAVSILIASYFRLVYLFVYNKSRYRIGALEHFSAYSSMVVVLLLGLSFFGFNSFLNASYWVSLPGLMVGLISTYYYYFWSNKIEWSAFVLPLAVASLITVQLAYSLSGLPFDYFTASALLVVIIYAIINTLRLDLQEKLTPGKIKHYFAFVVVSFIIIYLSAQWL